MDAIVQYRAFALALIKRVQKSEAIFRSPESRAYVLAI